MQTYHTWGHTCDSPGTTLTARGARKTRCGTDQAPAPWPSLAWGLTAALLALPVTGSAASDSENVFQAFTLHIENQIRVDKKVFVEADTCTKMFYDELRHPPSPPVFDGIAWRDGRKPVPALDPLSLEDCRRRYPGGVVEARTDFSRTQSWLTVSLTFYEYALVGDRNDDAKYSTGELLDILASFGLDDDPRQAPDGPVALLNAKFDDVHHAVDLEELMTSMGILYDKGYRLTSQDRMDIDRVMD